MAELFEKATRARLRFKVANGQVGTEDLWELPLERLDTLAKALNKEVKESAEESFIKTRSRASETLQLKFDVVKHVIDVKLAEKEAAKDAAERLQRKALLKEIIAKKELSGLEEKSIEDLKKELEAI